MSIEEKRENKEDKLGQRQSQTPFSSAFWVQKDFDYKKLLGPKHASSEKMLCPKLNLTCHNLI